MVYDTDCLESADPDPDGQNIRDSVRLKPRISDPRFSFLLYLFSRRLFRYLLQKMCSSKIFLPFNCFLFSLYLPVPAIPSSHSPLFIRY
jgi:hypothetical protein